MRAPYTKLHVHLVWATWDRAPLVRPEMEIELFNVLGAKAAELKCQTLALGGHFDHVHALVRMVPSISVSQLVGEMKGASSHWVNAVWRPAYPFKWQGCYGAFAVSPDAVESVEAYIRNQKIHHANRQLWDDWEHCFLPD